LVGPLFIAAELRTKALCGVRHSNQTDHSLFGFFFPYGWGAVCYQQHIPGGRMLQAGHPLV
jgi:hypothetical protein